MARYLAIDYGEKRIGLAFADELGVPVPLEGILSASEEARRERLLQEISRRGVTDFVVGYPYNMDGTVGSQARTVDAFIDWLSRHFILPVHRVDERLSSERAEMFSGPMSPKRRQRQRKKGVIDSNAALVFLREFMDSIHGVDANLTELDQP